MGNALSDSNFNNGIMKTLHTVKFLIFPKKMAKYTLFKNVTFEE